MTLSFNFYPMVNYTNTVATMLGFWVGSEVKCTLCVLWVSWNARLPQPPQYLPLQFLHLPPLILSHLLALALVCPLTRYFLSSSFLEARAHKEHEEKYIYKKERKERKRESNLSEQNPFTRDMVGRLIRTAINFL